MRGNEKSLQELNLEDDFLFAKVMSDEEVCSAVIEQILGTKIKAVKLLSEQKTIALDLDAKGIRLDVYVEDDAGTVFTVEMQKGYEADLAKRTRYYQGNIDLDFIEKGEPYRLLHKSYVIFICTFDYFKRGRHLYTFENLCLEDSTIRLQDDTQKIILNTKGTLDDVSQELKAFLHYVEHSTAETVDQWNSALLKRIHKRVGFIKTDKRLEVEYMTLLERDRKNREEGKAEGIMEGILEGKAEGIMELLSDLGTPSDSMKEKIMSTNDPEALKRWLKLAAKAETLDEFEKKMEP